MELLRQKDQQRLRQLQQTLADLEREEKQLTSERLQRNTHSNGLTFDQNTLVNISQVMFFIPKFGMAIEYQRWCVRPVLSNYKPKPNSNILILTGFHSDGSE